MNDDGSDPLTPARPRFTIADLVGLVAGYGVALGILARITYRVAHRDGLIAIASTTIVLNGHILARLVRGLRQTDALMAPFEGLVLFAHPVLWFGYPLVVWLGRMNLFADKLGEPAATLLLFGFILAVFLTGIAAFYLALLSTFVLVVSLAQLRPILGLWLATLVVVLIHLEVIWALFVSCVIR